MLNLWNGDTPGFDSKIGQAEPSLDPYLLNADKPHGAVVICPGGAYVTKAAHESGPVAKWLNSIGLSAFVLNYRAMPYKHPYPLEDAKRAIRYVRQHAAEWNIDPDRIGILGFSAGAHLAASAANLFDKGEPEADDPIERCSSRPDAAVLCYPVISFEEFGHMGSMLHLLGDNPPKELVHMLSLQNSVKDNTPQSFIWHTASDEGVMVENSLLYASALSAHKIPFELHIFPRGRHGLGLSAELPEVAVWIDLCEKWFAKIGFIEK